MTLEGTTDEETEFSGDDMLCSGSHGWLVVPVSESPCPELLWLYPILWNISGIFLGKWLLSKWIPNFKNKSFLVKLIEMKSRKVVAKG